MKIVRARQARRGAAVARARAGAVGQRVRRRHAGARVPGQEHQPQGRVARSARGRGARQHLCLRGAQPRAHLAQAQGVDHRDARRRAERTRRAAGRRDQGGARATRSRPAARRCAIIAQTDGELGISSTTSASTTARASRARRAAAKARSSASCRTAARRSSARSARSRTMPPLLLECLVEPAGDDGGDLLVVLFQHHARGCCP